jgi:hypothetical protein
LNWQHLTAFLWLRWRLMINQWSRAGTLNAVLMTIVAVGAVLLAVPLFVGSLLLGVQFLPKAQPAHLLYAWDALVVTFLFFWMIGLVTELQRTEPLALSKFLHLPVTVDGAFLINYVSSLLRLSLIVFVPMMLGFCFALIYIKGAALIWTLPLLAAFLLMVTALTYQFQGWLASMMSNPRKRRAIIFGITGIFIVLSQLPNLMNLYAPWGPQQRADRSVALRDELAKLEGRFNAGEFNAQEHLRRQRELMEQHKLENDRLNREIGANLERTTRLVNLVVPAGWLPLGAMAAAENDALPAVLSFLGMATIGIVSLRWAHRTTIRLYQGDYTSQKRPKAPELRAPSRGTGKAGTLLVERRLPLLSEPVSAIALGCFRSLVRSPEAKMMLLTPLVLGAVFGSTFVRGQGHMPDVARPLIASGGILLVLAGMLQLMANQFGFDRDGFRVYVLCAASRRDILLGKNLAFAPLAIGLSVLLVVLVQVFSPLRIEHFLSMFPQLVSMFVLFCLVMNLLSIYTPMHIAAGSLKPSNLKIVPALLQLAMVFVLIPLSQAPALLPLGIEFLLEWMGWTAGLPVCLILSLVECAVVILLYRIILDWEGGLFQAREQRILETVTNRPA